ncbi:MAG: transposase [Rhodobacteraceae bacterium]|nr:transposase [Paracoccaceae bacterium]
MFWRVRTGSPWRDLPPAFGKWNTQFRRFRRWAKTGVFEKLFKAMRRDPISSTPSSTAPSFRFTRRRPAQKGDPYQRSLQLGIRGIATR